MTSRQFYKWEPVELKQIFQQQKKEKDVGKLETFIQTPYGKAEIIEIRQNDFVAKLSYGTSYLPFDVLIEEPQRFEPEQPVSTAFGSAIVEALRLTADIKMYKVRLIEWKLAGGQHPVAYLKSQDVSKRSELTLDEVVQRVQMLKDQGNKWYQNKDYGTSVQYYGQGIQLLGRALPASIPPTEQLTSAVEEAFKLYAVALSNASQSLLMIPGTDLNFVLSLTAKGLSLDRVLNLQVKQKLLFRRARALMGLKQYQEAIVTLEDGTLENDAKAQKLKANAKKYIAYEIKMEKKRWTKALAKSSQDDNATTNTSDASMTQSVQDTKDTEEGMTTEVMTNQKSSRWPKYVALGAGALAGLFLARSWLQNRK